MMLKLSKFMMFILLNFCKLQVENDLVEIEELSQHVIEFKT